MPLILMLLACARQPAVTVTDAWDRDPAEAVALINDMPSELDQIAAVETLLLARPAAASGFCHELHPGAAADRCINLDRRPHLHRASTSSHHPKVREPGPRTASGPSTANLVPDIPPRPWPPASPPPGCQESACLRSAANEAIISGDVERVLGLCAAESTPDDRHECVFATAEQAIHVRGPQGQPSAAALCVQAGDFAGRCFDHLTSHLTRDAPSLSAPSDDWAPLIATAQAIQRYWASQDPDFGRSQADRLWSRALWNAINRTSTANAAVFDILPPEAAPHVRAALTWWLMSAPGATPDTLAQWVTRVEAVEERHGDPVDPSPGLEPGNRFSVTPAPYWTDDQPGDESVPAIFAFGSSRRTWSTDPHIDATICVIEAAARLWGPTSPLLDQGSKSDAPQVRWTSERLRQAMRERERFKASRR